jgi:hypothetical protein
MIPNTVPDIKLFAVRYSFLCPVCQNVDGGELIVNAKTGEEAMRQVKSRTLTCDFCSAEVPAHIGALDVEAA